MVPELSKVHESTDAQRSELSQNSDLKSSILKQVLDKGSSSSVKLENPGYTELKAKQNILNIGKSKMEKEVKVLKDLGAEMVIYSKGSSDYSDMIQEGLQHQQTADAFAQRCRDASASINGMSLETDPKVIEQQLEKTNNLIQKALVHSESLKAFKNRAKAVMNMKRSQFCKLAWSN